MVTDYGIYTIVEGDCDQKIVATIMACYSLHVSSPKGDRLSIVLLRTISILVNRSSIHPLQSAL